MTCTLDIEVVGSNNTCGHIVRMPVKIHARQQSIGLVWWPRATPLQIPPFEKSFHPPLERFLTIRAVCDSMSDMFICNQQNVIMVSKMNQLR